MEIQEASWPLHGQPGKSPRLETRASHQSRNGTKDQGALGKPPHRSFPPQRDIRSCSRRSQMVCVRVFRSSYRFTDWRFTILCVSWILKDWAAVSAWVSSGVPGRGVRRKGRPSTPGPRSIAESESRSRRVVRVHHRLSKNFASVITFL